VSASHAPLKLGRWRAVRRERRGAAIGRGRTDLARALDGRAWTA